MSKQLDALRALSPIREDFYIKVRIIRLWSLPPYGSFSDNDSEGSIDMVLCDRDVCYISLFSDCCPWLLYFAYYTSYCFLSLLFIL